MKSMTIGAVARQARVNVDTIRYYERTGLIPEPPRRQSGYRQYAEDVVDRIKFIKRAQELGFALREVEDLLTLRVDPESTCADVKEQTLTKIADIAGKIKTLQRMKRVLVELATACDARARTSECPILEAFETGER